MTSCPTCHADNDAGNAFCMSCGATLAAPGCTQCGAELAPGAKFCTGCGTAVSEPQAPGAVIGGEWLRPDGELVRRLGADQLRQAGWLPEALGGMAGGSVRVPAGSLGVVRVNGAIKEVLPAGWRRTPGFLSDLKSRGLEALLSERELSIHLIDTRPLPLTASAPLHQGDRTDDVRVTVLVSVDRSHLGTFLDHVVGDRESLSAADLHRTLQHTLNEAVVDALSHHGDRWAAVEKAIASALSERDGRRGGLRFDVTAAPKGSVHRRDISLGEGSAPQNIACPSCGTSLPAAQAFCTGCGATQPQRDLAPRLLTADGHEVELDLTLALQGRGEAPRIEAHLAAVATTALRSLDLSQADGIEAALREAATADAEAQGWRLVELTLVDLRAKGGQWLRQARADLTRRAEQLSVGREALTLGDDAEALRALTLAAARRQQHTDQAHELAQRRDAAADAEAHDTVAQQEERLARAQAERRHGDDLAAHGRAAEQAAAVQQSQADRQRSDAGLQSELGRQRVDDQAYATKSHDQAQLDKLAAMAALETQVSDAEQQRKLQTIEAMSGRSEAEILALQATELAGATHGAAFAEALGKLGEGKQAAAERALAAEQLATKDAQLHELAKAALGSTNQAHRQAVSSATETAKATMAANAQVAAAAAGASKACVHCSATLPGSAGFCGACGKKQ